MKIKWIGQAGLLIETGNIKIMVDPYLSESVFKINPDNYRRMLIDESLFNEKIDLILITHEHLDHLDPETLARFLKTHNEITVLAPKNSWEKLREFGGKHNYVQFNRGTEWTHENVLFAAVKAEHSDENAIGCVITAENKKYYIAGDTLYNKQIFNDLPNDIYAVFLPINGVGNNMNVADAKRFAEKTGAKFAVPVHWGMFDDINPEIFDPKNAIIPKLYEEIVFEKSK